VNCSWLGSRWRERFLGGNEEKGPGREGGPVGLEGVLLLCVLSLGRHLLLPDFGSPESQGCLLMRPSSFTIAAPFSETALAGEYTFIRSKHT
jgi:hypothetical protein